MASPAESAIRGYGMSEEMRSEQGLLEPGDARRLGLALLEETAWQTLGISNSRERWNAYAEVPVRISVLIPLAKVSLNDLLTLAPGTLLVSEWQTTQDLPMVVGNVFLATVSCEPAGDRLGIRINSFDQPAHGL